MNKTYNFWSNRQSKKTKIRLIYYGMEGGYILSYENTNTFVESLPRSIYRQVYNEAIYEQWCYVRTVVAVAS
jgi:hypothetical protein